MISVTLKGLLGRKLRAVLTAFAIILGVAMVSGTFVITDTIQKAFNGIFTQSYEQTDPSSPASRSSTTPQVGRRRFPQTSSMRFGRSPASRRPPARSSTFRPNRTRRA
jgi:hypothetical protein